MRLQKMRFVTNYNTRTREENIKTKIYVCAVDELSLGAEYTVCGCAIPDSSIESWNGYDSHNEGFEAVGEMFCGTIRNVTCGECKTKIKWYKKLK